MSALVKNLPFSPLFTGSALYLLTRSPPHIQQTALDAVLSVLSPKNTARLITSLKWLLALGLVRNTSNYLSKWADNDYQIFGSTKGWVWEKEIAVVTGGSSGFGALFAKDLSDKGIHVVVLDINGLPPHLQNNSKISFYKCDVTDADAVKAVAREVQSDVGHPSILINNAGIGADKTILETSPQFLKKIFGVNLFSHYYTLQAFMPDMLQKRKGHIVNIASIASFIATAGIVDYSCTKVAALALHEGLRAELRSTHKCPEIKTTVVHPIWADTPLIASGKAHLQKNNQIILNPQVVADAVVKQILNGRSGQIVLAPGIGAGVSSLRGFPMWIQETLRRLFEPGPVDLGNPDSMLPGSAKQ